ncbi:hypothetical protein ZWY2020_042111 [Hordeum vulgare]|nr:hypothetical protein ZWY2020_042111 [Hordeum vulgare]
MSEDPEETKEAPKEIRVPPKRKKLMGDAMKSPPKPAAKAKKAVASRKTTKDIPAAAKSKGPASSAHATEEEEDENAPVLRKLRPFLPLHNDAHPVAEDMKKRTTRFYETVLYDKSPAVSDMRYVDWTYIKENENFFPHVQENFKAVDIEDFVGKEMTPWNDELIVQFYATVHFYGADSLV